MEAERFHRPRTEVENAKREIPKAYHKEKKVEG
jgi:hypothetical protein